MVKKDKGFQITAHFIMVLLVLCCVLPFILLIMSSVTDEKALIRDGYSFIPHAFSLSAYEVLLFDSSSLLRAYGISFLVTIVGTLLNLTFTTLFAYPLSRKSLPGRHFFAFFIFFTMLFNGGLVPSYMMWTSIFNIKNTLQALIVPNLMMSAFYVIMMRTYFTANIPDAVIEAAQIDGAGEVRILLQVVLPMAVPIISTLTLLIGLNYWNDWTNGLYYINDDSLYSVQVLLNKMLLEVQYLLTNTASSLNQTMTLPATGIKMAVAVMGVLPILLIYPFFQRYFVQGITIGAVKG